MPHLIVSATNFAGERSKLVIEEITEEEYNGLCLALGTIADHILDSEDKDKDKEDF